MHRFRRQSPTGLVNIGVDETTSSKGNCDPGEDATDAQRVAVTQALEESPDVSSFKYINKDEAYETFLEQFADSPIRDSVTRDDIQDLFEITLAHPDTYQNLVDQLMPMRGISNIQNLDQFFAPLEAKITRIE